MNASHEIRTLKEFRGVTKQPVGVIVVTDTAWESKAHRTDLVLGQPPQERDESEEQPAMNE